MENKINIAKLLHNCTKGMELDCVIFNNVTLECVSDKGIWIKYIDSNGNSRVIHLTPHGEIELQHIKTECVIFPKGKTTWEGFVPHCQFKDGDVLTYMYYNKPTIYIYRKNGCCNTSYYVGYSFTNEQFYKDKTGGLSGNRTDLRLATEEEKAKLFRVIKDNGYKWNQDTKKLEKLIESKEDRHDEIVMSGIYFDRENYADEVELHLGNYEIEVRDGKTYAVFKNQKTKTLKPKFKVGDKIRHKKNNTIIKTITHIYSDGYALYDGHLLFFKEQDQYELVTDKFDISKLKPFDKVLVRTDNKQVWSIQFFERLNNRLKDSFICMGGWRYHQCIPYEGNEHLLNTVNDCEDYFKTWQK